MGANRQLYFEQIDIAKAFSIFMVVSYHIPPTLMGGISDQFSLFRMPLFFFVSGFLFKYEKYPEFITFLKRRSKHILIPYFSFFVIFYFLWVFIGRQFGDNNDKIASVWQPVYEFFTGNPQLVCAPTWFLVVLFVSQIFYYFIYRYSQNNTVLRILGCVALYFLYYFFCDSLIILPFQIVLVCKYIIFYAIGNSCKNICNKYLFNKQYLIYAIPIIILLVLLILCPVNYTSMSIINLAKSILLIALTLLVSNLLVYKKVCQIAYYYSYNAIIILCLQNYLIGVIKIILNKIYGYNLEILPFNFIVHISLFVLSIILFIPIITVINKYLPFIIGRSYKLQLDNK